MLVVPVASATVEKCLSAMKLVKTTLSNKIGVEHFSNRFICNVEKEELKKVSNKIVIRHSMNIEGKGRNMICER